MSDARIETTITGGQIQGIAGAGSVVIENFTIYNRAVEETLAAAEAGPIGPCPYPGLAYFGPDDAELFFGRDAAIVRLAEAVGRQSLTALVGASGSGKSSVVLAGLAPRLHGAGDWRFSHFRIGTELESNPFLALARAVVPLYVASDSDTERLRNTRLLATSLEAGELTLRDVFADCRSRNKGRRILLIADQFEEAFTLVEDEAVRHRFVDVLLGGFPDPGPGANLDISLIMTLRADFYGRALRHRPLADALQGHVENLGPMNREELQAAIRRPAENAKVSFEPGLVETLLDDVESKPGSLPLLQFALREMWGRQEKSRITRKSYDDIGGVEGALAQRAEAIFAAMTEDGANPQMEQAFQRLFTRLVTLGEGQEDTRRVVERRELGDDVWSLAQRLAGEDNRLIVTNAPAFSRETAEVVHEALIRHWPKLVGWIDRDRAFQTWLRQIRSNVELWSADPADEGLLLRGGMLAQAREWLARRRDDLSPAELGYIEASIALRQRTEEEQEAARQAEIKRQQELTEAAVKLANEQRRRVKWAVAGVVVAILLALFGGYEAYSAYQNEKVAVANGERANEEAKNAQEQADEARQQTKSAQRSRALMLAGLSMRETEAGRPERGLLLALAADPERPTRKIILINRDDVPLLTVAVERAIYAVLDGRVHEFTASWSPNARRVVIPSEDNAARVWDADSGEVVLSLVGHPGKVRNAAFSHDGERIVTASEDKTARIWDAETGQQVRALTGHQDPVNSAAFSTDGRRIVTASDDKTARIWDAETGQQVRALTGHEDRVNSAAFSADGRHIVTVSYKPAPPWDKTARIWDTETGQQVRALTQHSALSFSPDGRRIVTASLGQAWIEDAETGQEVVGKFFGHRADINSAAFSADGLRIVTASWDRTAQIWDAATGHYLRELRHQKSVISAAFSADGRHIVTASSEGVARIWDAETGQQARTLIWHAEPGQEVQALTGHEDRVSSASFSADGRRIVTASWDKTARIWDAATGQHVRGLTGHQGPVYCATFSVDGRHIVTASEDKTARIWDAETGQQVRAFTGHQGRVGSVAFSADGRHIVTASEDKTARIWDAATGQQVRALTGHQGQVGSVAFSADGQRIVTASEDKTARIWDAATGQQVWALTGHQKSVISAAFSADGRHIVTASEEGKARIWDAETGLQVLALAGDSASFSADGRHIVTVTDKTVRVWAVVPPVSELWELAGRLKHRDLTEGERREFFLND